VVVAFRDINTSEDSSETKQNHKHYTLATALLARVEGLPGHSGYTARISRHMLMFTQSHTYWIWPSRMLLPGSLLPGPSRPPISLKRSFAQMSLQQAEELWISKHTPRALEPPKHDSKPSRQCTVCPPPTLTVRAHTAHSTPVCGEV
jgi:hypothetical protein